MKYVDVVRKSIATGVATLKIDHGFEFWTRTKTGHGFQIGGFRDFQDGEGKPVNVQRGGGIIVKARKDGVFCNPRNLIGMKCFYKFYRDPDKNGVVRPYLYLRSDSADPHYIGRRVVVISAIGCFLVPEPSLREKIAEFRRVKAERKEAPAAEEESYAGLTFEEAVTMEYAWTPN